MNKDLPGVDKMKPSQLICKDPVLAAQFMHRKFNAIYDFIISEAQPLGEVIHHFGRTEYQTRLIEHRHCFFWIKDAPTIGVSSTQEVLDFIGEKISCKLPTVDEDPEMNRLVKRYQKHTCNSYCLRTAKSKGRVCKFGFPRDVRSAPVLHTLESSVASRQEGSYKKRLYEIVRTTQVRASCNCTRTKFLIKFNISNKVIRENHLTPLL